MKYIRTFFERFREKNQFVLDNRLPEFDYTLLPAIHSHDDLIWHEPDACKRYKFTEMFGYDGEFMVPYRRDELTLKTSFPVDALIEPDSFILIATLYTSTYVGQSYADIIDTKSTLKFIEGGMVKHTFKEWGDSELLREREGWYNRSDSNIIYERFLDIRFHDWETDYSTGKQVVDGEDWKLTIRFSNGETINSMGVCEYPQNWETVQYLFCV